MPGAGLHPQDALILIDVDDIVTFPARDEDGVNITGNIALAQDATAITIYGTPGTFVATSNSSGDADAVGFQPSIQFNHPGNTAAIHAFKTNWVGRKIVAIMKFCNGTEKWLFGSPCNPLQLQVNYEGNNESNRNQFTLQQISVGEDFAFYGGTDVALDTDE